MNIKPLVVFGSGTVHGARESNDDDAEEDDDDDDDDVDEDDAE
jgi:hypothetical protein